MLAIETSQRTAGVAFRDPGGVVHVERWTGAGSRDVELMPVIDRLVTGAGVDPGDIGAVGVSIGPGGFTGLRIAVSTARMLSLALGVDVVPVPSALVAAEGTDLGDRADGPVLVALAAKRSTFWATRLVRAGGAWRPADPAAGTHPGAGGALVETTAFDPTGLTAVLADRHFPDDAAACCAARGITIVEPVFDPVACLRLAEARREQGLAVAPATLLPLYPRPPEAVTLWKQRTR